MDQTVRTEDEISEDDINLQRSAMRPSKGLMRHVNLQGDSTATQRILTRFSQPTQAGMCF